MLAQGGQPLDRILCNAYPLAVEGITNKLITGAALGWQPRKTAREILRNGGLDRALNHILLVARDQQIRHYRESQREAYGRSRVVYGYKRLAAKSDRTCMACLVLDGTIYATKQRMEIHPQDRCALVPLVIGRSIPAWRTGLAYFKQLSPARQKKMLGPGKFAAWKAGDFELRQLVTVKGNEVWGDGVQVTSLKALRRGGGGVSAQRRYTVDELLRLHRLDLIAADEG